MQSPPCEAPFMGQCIDLCISSPFLHVFTSAVYLPAVKMVCVEIRRSYFYSCRLYGTALDVRIMACRVGVVRFSSMDFRSSTSNSCFVSLLPGSARLSLFSFSITDLGTWSLSKWQQEPWELAVCWAIVCRFIPCPVTQHRRCAPCLLFLFCANFVILNWMMPTAICCVWLSVASC